MKIALTPALAAALDRYRRAVAAREKRQVPDMEPAAEFRRDEGGENARRAVIAGPRDRREEGGEARGGEEEEGARTRQAANATSHPPRCAPVRREEVQAFGGRRRPQGTGGLGK